MKVVFLLAVVVSVSAHERVGEAAQAVKIGSGSDYSLWPQASVPFYFPATIDAGLKAAISGAAAEISRKTSVQVFEIPRDGWKAWSGPPPPRYSNGGPMIAGLIQTGKQIQASCETGSSTQTTEQNCARACFAIETCKAFNYAGQTCKLYNCQTVINGAGGATYTMLPAHPLRVEFNPSSGHSCYAYLGYQGNVDVNNNQYNMISLTKACPQGTVVHEFLHSLGFYHEHARSDRDKHVIIQWQYIEGGRDSSTGQQFKLADSNDLRDYSYDSVMHYCGYCGSNGRGPAIKTIDASKQDVIGQRNGLVQADIIGVNSLYAQEVAKRTRLSGSGGSSPAPSPVPVAVPRAVPVAVPRAVPVPVAVPRAPVAAPVPAGPPTSAGCTGNGDTASILGTRVGVAIARVDTSTQGTPSQIAFGCIQSSMQGAGRAIWRWTCPKAGKFSINTKGSLHPDTFLGVVPGSCDGNQMQCNDDFTAGCSNAGGSLECASEVNVTCTANAAFVIIAVPAAGSYEGVVTLNILEIVTPTVPVPVPVAVPVATPSSTGAEWVEQHNIRRRQEVNACPRLPNVVWNTALAAFAQGFVDSACAAGKTSLSHTSNTERQNIGGFRNIGENLFWGTGSWTATDAVTSWYSEKEFWTAGATIGQANSCVAGKMCGHYTQVVWAKSTAIGCGRCVTGRNVLISCVYGEAGNFQNQRPYEISAPGATCTSPGPVPVAPPPRAPPVAPPRPPVPVAVPVAPTALVCSSGFTQNPLLVRGCERACQCPTTGYGQCTKCCKLTGDTCSIRDPVNSNGCPADQGWSRVYNSQCISACGCNSPTSLCSRCCKTIVQFGLTYCTSMTPATLRDRLGDVAQECPAGQEKGENGECRSAVEGNGTTTDPTAGLSDPDTVPLKVGVSRVVIPSAFVPAAGGVTVKVMLKDTEGDVFHAPCPVAPAALDAMAHVSDFAGCVQSSVADRRLSMSGFAYNPFVDETYTKTSPGRRPTGKMSVHVMLSGAATTMDIGEFNMNDVSWTAGDVAQSGEGRIALGSGYIEKGGVRALLSFTFNCSSVDVANDEPNVLCHSSASPRQTCTVQELNEILEGKNLKHTCADTMAGKSCPSSSFQCPAGLMARGVMTCMEGGHWSRKGIECINLRGASCRNVEQFPCNTSHPVCDFSACSVETYLTATGDEVENVQCPDQCQMPTTMVVPMKVSILSAGGLPVTSDEGTAASLRVEYREGVYEKTERFVTEVKSPFTCSVYSGSTPSFGEECPKDQRFSNVMVNIPKIVPARSVKFVSTIVDSTSDFPRTIATYSGYLTEAVTLKSGLIELELASERESGAVLLRLELADEKTVKETCMIGSMDKTAERPSVCYPFEVSVDANAASLHALPCQLDFLEPIPNMILDNCSKSIEAGKACFSQKRSNFDADSGIMAPPSISCMKGYELAGGDLRCGWDGHFQEPLPQCIDIDECSTSVCDPNAQCVNLPGSFECKCGPNFRDMGVPELGLYGECVPLPPNAAASNKLCSEKCADPKDGGLCALSDQLDPSSGFCTCMYGYSGDGKTCVKDTIPFRPLAKGVTAVTVPVGNVVNPALIPNPVPMTPPMVLIEDKNSSAVAGLAIGLTVFAVAAIALAGFVVFKAMSGRSPAGTSASYDQHSFARPLAREPQPESQMSYVAEPAPKALYSL